LAGNITRRDMNELRIQQLHELDQIPYTVHIRDQRFIERGTELHEAGGVYDHVHSSAQLAHKLRTQTAEGKAQIPLDDRDLPPDVLFPELFHDPAQRRGLQDLGVETSLAGK